MKLISIDLGAGSGRIVLTDFDGNVITSREIYRFNNDLIYLGVVFIGIF
jgi:ribulose kinase